MSGHSKWSKIKHGKAATDKQRGKVFTKHAKLIQVAARNGGDPDMNPLLRAAIESARADNVPYDNIDRAIKKGTGELKQGQQIEEVMYEGFGPGGSAVYINALTDNRNRTITNLKIIMGKKGGTMGAAGSVGYLFEKKGMIAVPINGLDHEEVELQAIDAGAEDIEMPDDTESDESAEKIIEIYTKPGDLMSVRGKIEQGGIKVNSAELIYVPQTTVKIDDDETAEKISSLIEALEEDDDVLTVFSNAEF